MQQQSILIITDLDGTLLDHHTYSFEAALPALNYLGQQHIPLILNSSKTAAEILSLRLQLDNHDPFVVENGAGIYLEKEGQLEKIDLGLTRENILSTIHPLRDEYGFNFTGFADMHVDQVMAATNLDEQQATRAMQRDYTEPLQWQDTDANLQRFIHLLEEAGLTALQGGRFLSVSGKVDKGQAMQWLRDYYQQQNDCKPTIIALGDSENDRAMLEQADYSVLVRSPVHALPDIENENLTVSRETGPQGWNDSVMALLEFIKKKR